MECLIVAKLLEISIEKARNLSNERVERKVAISYWWRP